ncbi:MAG: anthranilate phosphoribosyltransferase [Phycisphaeraceae bacterium]
MQELLRQLVAGKSLSVEQAVQAFEAVMTGQASPAQTAALLALIEQRGPTVDEIVGAATVMRAHVTAVDVPAGLTVIDTCGTGGDSAGTFNISTAAALVAAGAARAAGGDIAVAKHGNRSVTSSSGSSQVLEALGVKLGVAPACSTQCLAEARVCFCFAPAHHPAMKHAAPVRAELGFRTIFNIVGPLTNPAAARRQLVGVYSSNMTETIARVLAQLGAEHAMVVHGQIPDADGRHIDGLDELSTAGPTRVSEVRGGKLATYELSPDTLGLPYSHPSALRVDSVEASAALIRRVLDGEPGPARDIVLLNAAAALRVAGLADDLEEGIARAGEAIDAEHACAALEALVKLTNA